MPRCGSTCAKLSSGRRGHIGPQRHRHPGTLRPFPCKTATSEGAVGGAMGAVHGPRTCRRPLRLVAGGEGRAPVVAVLAPVMKSHSSPSAHPKALAPPRQAISPARRQLLRVPQWGSWVPIMDPAAHLFGAFASGSWWRRSCPRCGSTCSRREKSRSRRWRPPKDMDPRHRRLFLLQSAGFWGCPQWGPRR
jgi:hypothetical protein